jgi:hypothetical protein
MASRFASAMPKLAHGKPVRLGYAEARSGQASGPAREPKKKAAASGRLICVL